GVEDRPVGDSVGAVFHPFRLAVRRGDRTSIEVIAANNNGRLQLAAADHLVEAQAELGALAVTEPTDAGRQSLELHFFPSQVNPAGQRRFLRESWENGPVGAINVFGIAGKSCPAERTLAFAERRPNVFGDETRNAKGIFHTRLDSLGANVVAV